MLHISVDPINIVCVFSGLEHLYGVLKSISNPRRVGPGTFYITVMPVGASWACRYLLHKDNMTRPIPQGLLDRRLLFPRITPMARWWSNNDEIDCEQHVRVTRAVVQLSTGEVKRLKQYMLTCRLVDAKIAEFLAEGGVGASLLVHHRFPFRRSCLTPRRTIPFIGPWHSRLTHREEGLPDPFVVPMRGTSPRTERVAVGEPMQQQWQSRGLLWICRTKRWTDLPLDPANNMMRPI